MGKRALVVQDAEALARRTPLQRLNEFRSSVPWVSQTALSSILLSAKREELPSAARRADIRKARDDVVNTMAPYGKVHKTIVVPSRSVETWWSRCSAPGLSVPNEQELVQLGGAHRG